MLNNSLSLSLQRSFLAGSHMNSRFIQDPLGLVFKLEHCTYNLHAQDGGLQARVPSVRVRVEDEPLSCVVNSCVKLLHDGRAEDLHRELADFQRRLLLLQGDAVAREKKAMVAFTPRSPKASVARPVATISSEEEVDGWSPGVKRIRKEDHD